MVQYKTEALVLRSRKYKEADGLITLLTRERGKVGAVAKGIYKPTSKLRGGVQPYSLNNMLLNAGRSNLSTLIQSDCIEMFLPLRQDFDALSQASYWAELLECFAVEEQQDQDLFQLALAGFYGLATNPDTLLCHALEVRLMKMVGYSPSLEVCSCCSGLLDGQGSLLFSAQAGGLICRHCIQDGLNAHRISPTVVSLWKSLEKIGINKMGRIKVQAEVQNQLDKVIKEWIVFQSGKPMKSWNVLKKIGGKLNE